MADNDRLQAARDAKLAALRDMIARKCAQPINSHDGRANRKIIVFTAFSDTAHYLYAQLAPWARNTLGVHSAVVTGSAGIQTTMPGLSKRMGDVLSAFAPRATMLGHCSAMTLTLMLSFCRLSSSTRPMRRASSSPATW